MPALGLMGAAGKANDIFIAIGADAGRPIRKMLIIDERISRLQSTQDESPGARPALVEAGRGVFFAFRRPARGNGHQFAAVFAVQERAFADTNGDFATARAVEHQQVKLINHGASPVGVVVGNRRVVTNNITVLA